MKKPVEPLAFLAPKPSAVLQRLAFLVNRLVFLRPSRLRIAIAAADAARMRALPRDAGNVLVGAHPGPSDPYLMFHLYHVLDRLPAGFLMAAEPFYRRPWIVRALLRRLGAMPVARGRRNPEAVAYMSAQIASGRWCGMFPEGEIYYSRDLMPMEHGAVRIAIDAALEAQRRARGSPPPVLITPFAHVYFYRDPDATLRLLASALGALEARPEVHGAPQDGDVVPRLREVASRIIEHRAERYAVPAAVWRGGDRFERAHRLADYVLEELEHRHLGEVRDDHVRRRALRARMKLFELLETETRADARERLLLDVQKTRDIVMTVPFSPDYVARHGDLEMAAEYLQRYCWVLGLPAPWLGSQEAEVRFLDPTDAHLIAGKYEARDSEAEGREHLSRCTEDLRARIQDAVDRIVRERPTRRLPGW